MKKLLMLFAVVAFIGTSATAQCTKSKSVSGKTCTKSKTACTKAKTVSTDTKAAELPACPTAAAAKLASMDESIESRTCAKSGKTAYYKKSSCEKSGKTYFQEVKFDGDSKAFVNVAPSKGQAVKAADTDGTKKTCSKSKASCSKAKTVSAERKCTKTASAKTVSLEKKSCSKSKATAGKSCCASKKAAAKTVSTEKKSCSKTASASKSCCASKKAKTVSAPASEGKAKLVKEDINK
jgi:hypothetical protein